MASIDGDNLFALCVATISTADAFAQDNSLPSDLRAAAAAMRDAMKSFKTAAFAFRDLAPPKKSAGDDKH
jgi:hypothetical protein